MKEGGLIGQKPIGIVTGILPVGALPQCGLCAAACECEQAVARPCAVCPSVTPLAPFPPVPPEPAPANADWVYIVAVARTKATPNTIAINLVSIIG